MPELPLSWRQIGTLLFFGGFAWWALRWSGRNLRAQLGDRASRPRMAVLSSDEVDAIVSRQLASPVELFSMSAAEQRLLAQTAMAMTTATPRAPATVELVPPRTFCPQCGGGVENWPAQVPWRCACTTCGALLVLRRDQDRFVISYTPPA